MVIGLQTFTIRNIFQTEDEIDSTLKSLKDMGINYLELAYIPWNIEHITMLKKYLDKYQIQAISTQLTLKTITTNYEQVIKMHQLLNIKYLAISVIPFTNLLLGYPGLKSLALKLNKLGATLKNDGIQLLFHHHNYEFFKFPRGMAIDILLTFLDPTYCQILSDTYWIKKGGFKIIDFLEKYKKHIKALHLRGFIKNKDTNMLETEINFKKIIEYAEEHNYYYGVIEQNTEDALQEINKSIISLNLIEKSELLSRKEVE